MHVEGVNRSLVRRTSGQAVAALSYSERDSRTGDTPAACGDLVLYAFP
jgi:hypothetical protein